MIFDVVAEYPQEPHIPEHVQPSGVNEHGCENREERAADGVLRTLECELKMMRYFGVAHQERVPSLPSLHADPNLVGKLREIQDHDRIRHVWPGGTRLVVAKRDHTLGRFPVPAVLSRRLLRVIGPLMKRQAGGTEHFFAGLATRGMNIADVSIAIAAAY